MDELNPSNFKTAALLRAVEAVDEFAEIAAGQMWEMNAEQRGGLLQGSS